MTQRSGSVERGTQDQLLVQQSSPSVPASSHSGEFMSRQGAWFGHSQYLKFHASSSEFSVVSCHPHCHCQLSSAQRLSVQFMRQEVVVSISSHHKGSVSNVNSVTCLPHWLKKRGMLFKHSESSSCRLISCYCHASHAQMHAGFKGPNPGPYSGLVSFISGDFVDSGHVHIL